ncbi:MAG: hypothetical protein ING19_08565, partial [Azospirillum sp.]|nr:hypothetical protein [Azospirillum sp.]
MDGKSFLRRVFSRLFKGPSDNAASDNAGAENAEKAANALPQKDRDLLAALTVAGARANVSRDVVGTTRRLVARAARATPQRIADFMSSLSEISTVASDVEKSLVKDPSIVFGRAGARVGAGRGSALDSADQSSFRFDVRDVRFWVGFAAHAGVAHVPFREVLRLSDAEISALSGQISLPDIATVRRFSGN